MNQGTVPDFFQPSPLGPDVTYTKGAVRVTYPVVGYLLIGAHWAPAVVSRVTAPAWAVCSDNGCSDIEVKREGRLR